MKDIEKLNEGITRETNFLVVYNFLRRRMEGFSFSSPSSYIDIEMVGWGGQKNKPTDQSPLWLLMTNSEWNISNLIWKCILKILHCDQEEFILSMQEWFTSEIPNDSLHSIKREVTEY